MTRLLLREIDAQLGYFIFTIISSSAVLESPSSLMWTGPLDALQGHLGYDVLTGESEMSWSIQFPRDHPSL